MPEATQVLQHTVTLTITTDTTMDRTETVITVKVYRMAVVQGEADGERTLTVTVRVTAIETAGMQDTISVAEITTTVTTTIILVIRTAVDQHKADI